MKIYKAILLKDTSNPFWSMGKGTEMRIKHRAYSEQGEVFEMLGDWDGERLILSSEVQIVGVEDGPTEPPLDLQPYEMVEHPKHYNNYSVEVIDMMERIYGTKDTIAFCEMNAFKYRMRLGTKPDNSIEQDLAKEKWYIDKAKELRAKLQKYESSL